MKTFWWVLIVLIVLGAIISAVNPSEEDSPPSRSPSVAVDEETRETCRDSWYSLPKGPGDASNERAGFTQSEFVGYCVAYEKELQK